MMAGLLATVLFEMGCMAFQKKAGKSFKQAVDNKESFDAIIVLGIPFKNGQWDSIMKARVIWSYVLYKNGIARHVIYSGAAVYSPYCEAQIMGLYGIALGIPAEDIFYDTLAQHSTENVYYSYELARSQGFKSIALATDPFQSKMLQSFMRRRFASPIAALPFVVDSLKAYNALTPEINPVAVFKNNFVPITEREGFWKRLKATMGNDIPWSKYKDGIVPEL